MNADRSAQIQRSRLGPLSRPSRIRWVRPWPGDLSVSNCTEDEDAQKNGAHPERPGPELPGAPPLLMFPIAGRLPEMHRDAQAGHGGAQPPIRHRAGSHERAQEQQARSHACLPDQGDPHAFIIAGPSPLPAGAARSKLAESSFSHQQGSAAKACSIGHSPPAQCSGHTADSGTPPVRQADLLDRRLHLQVFIRRLLLQQPVIACTADDGQNAHPFQGPIL